MKRKRIDKEKIKEKIIVWLLTILLFAAIMLVSKFMYELITESSLPDWLKWFLLA